MIASQVVKKDTKTKILHQLILSLFNQGDKKNVAYSVVLYGHPEEGKTTFAANLCKLLIRYTGKKGIYFATDENLRTPFGERMERISKADWIYLEYPHPRVLMAFLNRLRNPEQYCILVVDSITGLFETIAEEYGDPTHPRINLALIRWASMITKKLAALSHRYNIVTILIAHKGSMYDDEWLGMREKPAFSLRSLKNVDVTLKTIAKKIKKDKTEIVERYIKVVTHRYAPDFNNKEFTVEELLSGDIDL